MSEDTGDATDTGEQTAKETPQTQTNSQEQQEKKPEQAPPGSVPYQRFAAVVEQRKGLEATLNSLIDGMVDELPEDVRDLVPNLPPAEKAAWIRAARERGLFGSPDAAPASSPDAKRPGGKQPIDLSGMNATEKLRFGFSQRK